MTAEPAPAPPVRPRGTGGTDPLGLHAEEAMREADDAAQHAGVHIQAVRTYDDCTRVATVLNRIWGPSPAAIIDHAFLVALAHSGNLVALATHDGRDVGAAVGFSGPPDTAFHSHIVGVLAHGAGSGVGGALKLHQRAWCLARGITTMSWTYDPLVARNAAFNIRRLGALPHQYRQNFYGPMGDAINAGQDSDRMVIRWDLMVPAPVAASSRPEPVTDRAVLALANTGDQPGEYAPPGETDRVALVGVPRDIEAIRREDADLARDWRAATATAFVDLFERGWRVGGFAQTGHYVLHHERTPTA